MTVVSRCEVCGDPHDLHKPLQRLAPQAGLEPATQWLTVTVSRLCHKAFQATCDCVVKRESMIAFLFFAFDPEGMYWRVVLGDL